ncbi:MAG: hypothetical protein ACKVOO_12555 [Burkholderiaceae bacterium]
MNHLNSWLYSAVLLTLCLPAMAVNKCTAPDGKVSFQDAACPNNSSQVRDDFGEAKKAAALGKSGEVMTPKQAAEALQKQLDMELMKKPRVVRPNPPVDDAVTASSAVSMTMRDCKASVETTIRTMAVRWVDVRRIVNSPELAMTKICTSDGSVTVTCSAPDQQMVTTRGERC